MRRYKLQLEDLGQDFRWFVVEDDTIIDAGPFQALLWAGRKLTANRFAVGDALTFVTPLEPGAPATLKYHVTGVTKLPWREPGFAKQEALRDAVDAGGLLRVRGDGYVCVHPANERKRYVSNTIKSLLVHGLLQAGKREGKDAVFCTAEGVEALPWASRPTTPKHAGPEA